MEPTGQDNEREYAFAEMVRRMALRVTVLIGSKRYEEAADVAASICSESARRQREVRGLPEPAEVDATEARQENIDREHFGSPSDGLDLDAIRREFGDGDTPPATG